MKAWKRHLFLLLAVGFLTLVCATLALAAKGTRKISRGNWSKRAGVCRQVSHTTVTAVKASKSNDSKSPDGNEVVESAMTFRGNRYVYGGTSRSGFDCSGFTRYVFARFGITLPHSAAAQSRLGKAVTTSELKPGDLLFFGRKGRISHVGIFAGNGRMVHAANPRRGVVTDSIFSSYYRSRLVAARRLAN